MSSPKHGGAQGKIVVTFSWRRNRKAPTPLYDWLVERNSDWLEQFVQDQIESADDGQKLLRMLIFAGVLTCAGLFIGKAGRRISKKIGNVGADALAFEVLAFSFYAVRESHLPTPDDPFDDWEADELVDGYRFAMGAIPSVVTEETGWDIDDLWRRRVLFYFQQNDMKAAAESFVGILLTMKDMQVPSRDYGRLSLDLALNVKLRLLIHTYASEIPRNMADTLQSIAVDHGLIL